MCISTENTFSSFIFFLVKNRRFRTKLYFTDAGGCQFGTLIAFQFVNRKTKQMAKSLNPKMILFGILEEKR